MKWYNGQALLPNYERTKRHDTVNKTTGKLVKNIQAKRISISWGGGEPPLEHGTEQTSIHASICAHTQSTKRHKALTQAIPAQYMQWHEQSTQAHVHIHSIGMTYSPHTRVYTHTM